MAVCLFSDVYRFAGVLYICFLCQGLSCCISGFVCLLRYFIVAVLRDAVFLCLFSVSQDSKILFRDYLNSFLYDVVCCVYDLEIFAHIPKVTRHKSLHL